MSAPSLFRPAGRAAAASLLVFAAACGDDDSSPTPPADAGADSATDATSDTTTDATTDAGADGGTDTSDDAGADADADTGTDVGADADTGSDIDVSPPTYGVTGTSTAEGIEGSVWLELTAEGAEPERVEAGVLGGFAFGTVLEDGTPYEVRVTDHPLEGYCDVSPSEGVVDGSEVALTVTCVPGFTFETEETSDYGNELYRYWILEEDGEIILREAWSDHPGDDGISYTDDDDNFGFEETFLDLEGSERRSIEYSGLGPDGEMYTDDDPIAQYSDRAPNEYGDATQFIIYIGPGDDDTWFTEDDEMRGGAQLYPRAYDEEGRNTCIATVYAGPDMLLNTDDDQFNSGTVYAYSDHPVLDGTLIEVFSFTDAGPDDAPCTDDDVMGSRTRAWIESDDGLTEWSVTDHSEYTEERIGFAENLDLFVTWSKDDGVDIGGPEVDAISEYTIRMQRAVLNWRWSATATQPGPDGEWLTEDDFFEDSTTRAYPDEDGELRILATYNGSAVNSMPGPDYEWGTDDDFARVYRVRSIDEDGGYRCFAEHVSPGDNGIWDTTVCGNSDTADDMIQYVAWEKLDEMGRVSRWCRSVETGDDGIWLTDDDLLYSGAGVCGTREYVTDTVFVSREIQANGDDGIPFTEDDVHDIRILELDDHGREILRAHVDGPGDDGLWYTGDDEVEAYDTEEYDRSGNFRAYGEAYSAGPDGLWFNEDDVPEESGEYEQSPYVFLLRDR